MSYYTLKGYNKRNTALEGGNLRVWKRDRVKRFHTVYRANVNRLEPAALTPPKLQYKEFSL